MRLIKWMDFLFFILEFKKKWKWLSISFFSKIKIDKWYFSFYFWMMWIMRFKNRILHWEEKKNQNILLLEKNRFRNEKKRKKKHVWSTILFDSLSFFLFPNDFHGAMEIEKKHLFKMFDLLNWVIFSSL